MKMESGWVNRAKRSAAETFPPPFSSSASSISQWLNPTENWSARSWKADFPKSQSRWEKSKRQAAQCSWFVTDSEVSTQEKVRTTASDLPWIKTTVSGALSSPATWFSAALLTRGLQPGDHKPTEMRRVSSGDQAGGIESSGEFQCPQQRGALDVGSGHSGHLGLLLKPPESHPMSKGDPLKADLPQYCKECKFHEIPPDIKEVGVKHFWEKLQPNSLGSLKGGSSPVGDPAAQTLTLTLFDSVSFQPLTFKEPCFEESTKVTEEPKLIQKLQLDITHEKQDLFCMIDTESNFDSVLTSRRANYPGFNNPRDWAFSIGFLAESTHVKCPQGSDVSVSVVSMTVYRADRSDTENSPNQIHANSALRFQLSQENLKEKAVFKIRQTYEDRNGFRQAKAKAWPSDMHEATEEERAEDLQMTGPAHLEISDYAVDM
ncbi:hypothetical protein MJG53_002248 [Ovis ammon polii x Ovis aries]|uniref:Uncharacterized protein n=1 Tax=Ovis ammon polii x Ovis aries TaxID=2918886 RepID=A0ACB9VMD9_9CETA|nr:hypothetical protein MJG53_002248 [Ovis ammon polii x Ovis aries]